MKYQNLLLAVVCVMLLSACAPITAPFNEPEVMRTITTFPGPALSPVYDGNPACPNISGEYRDTSVFLLRRFPEINNRNGIVVKKTVLRGELRERSGGVGTFYYHDTQDFYQQAILAVGQKEKILTITLMDNERVPYKRIAIDMDNTAIGCVNGALIIRNSYYSGGSEGRIGYAYAEENQWRKLADGNLQVKIERREWNYSFYSGLIGFGSDNKPSGNEPRIKKQMGIFPTVK